MAKNTATTLLRKIAAEVYDESAAGKRFTLDQVVCAVLASPAVEGLGAQLAEAAAWAAVKYVDESRTARVDSSSLFEDMDRVIALGEGNRRRKGACRKVDMAEHVRIVAENAHRAMAAAKAEAEELDILAPFFSEPETTVEQAVASYKAAQS